jgi:hypothetical protein
MPGREHSGRMVLPRVRTAGLAVLLFLQLQTALCFTGQPLLTRALAQQAAITMRRAQPLGSRTARRCSSFHGPAMQMNDLAIQAPTSEPSTSGKAHETDVVVIGSGLGGLCAGALLAKYGYKVTICEAHYLPGGCAHGFDIKSKKGEIFKFDAGPSLWAGMSQPSTNPLRQVMDAVGANVEWNRYDGWGVYFPDGYFRFNIGPSDAPGGFEDVLKRFEEPGGSLQEWKKLQEIIKPLILAATAFPPMCLRADLGALKTLQKYLPTFLSFGPTAAKINGPFAAVMKEAGMKEGTFLYRWLDYLSFALSGLLADGTICAAVSYTLGDLHVRQRAHETTRACARSPCARTRRGVESGVDGGLSICTHTGKATDGQKLCREEAQRPCDCAGCMRWAACDGCRQRASDIILCPLQFARMCSARAPSSITLLAAAGRFATLLSRCAKFRARAFSHTQKHTHTRSHTHARSHKRTLVLPACA